LSPDNPTFKVLDTRPITVPHHSIIGGRGKGDTPNSSDGVVEYWSSSLKSAKSGKIVPGPHGACELPETITEPQRKRRLADPRQASLVDARSSTTCRCRIPGAGMSRRATSGWKRMLLLEAGPPHLDNGGLHSRR
jgi:hypothetical protein